MEMVDGLSPVLAVVDDNPIPVIKLGLLRYLPCNGHQVSKKRLCACMRAYVRACMRACVRAYRLCVCAWMYGRARARVRVRARDVSIGAQIAFKFKKFYSL